MGQTKIRSMVDKDDNKFNSFGCWLSDDEADDEADDVADDDETEVKEGERVNFMVANNELS